MTDPITDMLNRIRNAQAVFQQTVEIPFSNLKYEIAKILEKAKFTGKSSKVGKKTKKTITIVLKYHSPKQPVILGLRRVSKPGQRAYCPAKKIKQVMGGYGIAIISTPKGLMINKEARKQGLGGEVLCEIW